MTPSPRVLHNAKASAHMYAQCNAHTCAITHNTHTGYGRGCRECTWTPISQCVCCDTSRRGHRYRKLFQAVAEITFGNNC